MAWLGCGGTFLSEEFLKDRMSSLIQARVGYKGRPTRGGDRGKDHPSSRKDAARQEAKLNTGFKKCSEKIKMKGVSMGQG